MTTLAVWILGAALAWAVVPPGTTWRPFAAAVLGPGLGLGLLSIAVFGSFEVGAGFPSRWFLWGALAGTAAVAVALRLRGSSRTETPPRRAARTWPKLASLLLLASMGLVAYHAWKAVRARPHGGADAMRIWNGRARILYRAQDEAPAVFGRIKTGHPDYPLFLSASLAGQFQLAGGESLRIPQATGGLLAAGCAGALVVLLTSVAGTSVGLIGGAVLLATPAFVFWAFEQCSDLALAYVAVVALGGLLSVVRPDRDASWKIPPLLTGFFVGLLAWVKDEGIVLMCALLAGLILTLWGKRARALPWKDLAGIGAGMILPLAATARFKASWVVGGQITQLASDGPWEKLLDPERWRMVALAFATEVSPFHRLQNWGLVWPAIAMLAAWHWRDLWNGPGRRLATVAVLSSLGGYGAIYLLTPQPLEWHLRTSIQRLFLQLLPLFMVWAGVLLGNRRGSPGEPRSEVRADGVPGRA